MPAPNATSEGAFDPELDGTGTPLPLPVFEERALLPLRNAEQVRSASLDPIDTATLEGARAILERVRVGGDAALREVAVELGDLGGVPGPSAPTSGVSESSATAQDRVGSDPGPHGSEETSETTRGPLTPLRSPTLEPMILGRDELQRDLQRIPKDQRALLERVAERITGFARAQLEASTPVRTPIPGGFAGEDRLPLDAVGCYAPGGRAPLPSSVLMTACTARAAGVGSVWVASPRPLPIVRAAATIAGADALLCVGGAQAIAAFAYGTETVPCVDRIVGPGNRWVTAAKRLVRDRVGIDFEAGPSELLILADATANPAWVAADLLAQAEHDPDARPMLIATDADLLTRVESELQRQLPDLSTADTARAALASGFAHLAASRTEAIALANRLAPEHLSLQVASPESWRPDLRHAGALFLGPRTPEALGDYGAGPNHVLPTGGTARFESGLSVRHFLRHRTYLEITDPSAARTLYADTAALAKLESLPAHARSSEIRWDVSDGGLPSRRRIPGA